MKDNLYLQKIVIFLRLGYFILLGIVNTGYTKPPAGYELSWFDEFEADTLDLTKWEHHSLGQRHDAINTSEAISINDGCLVISTYTENNIHYTGMVSSYKKFETKYGYWEARMKFQDASGTFSDFWLYTMNLNRRWFPGSTPANNGVEIDIVEHRLVNKESQYINGINSINLHWGEYGEKHEGDGIETPDLDIGNGFHTFGLEWTESYYKFYIDDKLVWYHDRGISKVDQFIIFSTEVKDRGWAGPILDGGYGSKQFPRVRMWVDYVRHYKLID